MAGGQMRTEIYNSNRNECFWECRPHTAGTHFWREEGIKIDLNKHFILLVGHQQEANRSFPTWGWQPSLLKLAALRWCHWAQPSPRRQGCNWCFATSGDSLVQVCVWSGSEWTAADLSGKITFTKFRFGQQDFIPTLSYHMLSNMVISTVFISCSLSHKHCDFFLAVHFRLKQLTHHNHLSPEQLACVTDGCRDRDNSEEVQPQRPHGPITAGGGGAFLPGNRPIRVFFCSGGLRWAEGDTQSVHGCEHASAEAIKLDCEASEQHVFPVSCTDTANRTVTVFMSSRGTAIKNVVSGDVGGLFSLWEFIEGASSTLQLPKEVQLQMGHEKQLLRARVT